MMRRIGIKFALGFLNVGLGLFVVLGAMALFNKEFEWYIQVSIFIAVFIVIDMVCWLKGKL